MSRRTLGPGNSREIRNGNSRLRVWFSYPLGYNEKMFLGSFLRTPLHHPIRAPIGPKQPNSAQES